MSSDQSKKEEPFPFPSNFSFGSSKSRHKSSSIDKKTKGPSSFALDNDDPYSTPATRVSRSYSVAVGMGTDGSIGAGTSRNPKKLSPALARLDTSSSSTASSDTNIKTRLRRAASTVSADSWGIHSVPSLLSDFRKHTSHNQRERSSIASPMATRPPPNPLSGPGSTLSQTFDDLHKTLTEINVLSPAIDTHHSHSHDYFSSHPQKSTHTHSHNNNNDHHSHKHSHLDNTIYYNPITGASPEFDIDHCDHVDHIDQTQQQPPPPPSLIERVPALISLPTSLLGLDYLCVKLSTSDSVKSFLSTSLVTGSLLLTAGILTLIMNRQSSPTQHQFNKIDVNNTIILAAGTFLLFWACSLLGSVKSTLIVATLFNAPYLFLHPINLPYYIYLAILFVADAFRLSTGDATNQMSLWKLGGCYLALFIAAYCLHRPSATYSGVVSLVLGAIISAPAVVSATHFSLDVVTLIVISSGSLGVFLLSKRDLHPNRLNPMLNTLLSMFLERSVFVKGTISLDNILYDVGSAFFSMILIPDKIYLRSAPLFDPTSPPESIRNWGIIDSILAHDDTKNIFYFLLLNFSFMLIQLLYSILSHSLGLLSDSIHMFFDCLALFVGLIASILSKFPPSTRFPYGLGKVETLSGFTNGFLLIGISLGVIAEAMERISVPVELEKTTELLIVSFLGLVVNIVGIFAFNHGHSHSHGGGGGGHSHSHALGGHSHSETNNHNHEHSHNNEKCETDHGHDHDHDHSHSHGHGESNDQHNEQSHEHAHSHSNDSGDENENMRGILLHIIADTLGSVGVIASTILIYYFGWEGFDPVASILIAVLIFMSAVPLISSAAKTLLLSLNDNQEYNVRNMLSDISIMPGVAGYTVPRFWADGSSIRGVIHVQVLASFDSPQVKSRVEKRLEHEGVKAFVQTEPVGSNCWCRNV